MDSLLVKVIVQSLYTVLTLFGGGVHTSPTMLLRKGCFQNPTTAPLG